MPKVSTEHLLEVIDSLTKAEKRNFRLYAERNNKGSALLFVQVYDFIDKYGKYDENLLLKKNPKLKKSQLSNIKSHLYKQLLASLRRLDRKSELDITIRDQLDYSRILYNKGLYKASLALLDKTKKIAWTNGYFSSALSALEFEKFIESQYVTGSMYPKADLITKQTAELMEKLTLTHKLSNLSLSMYAYYLQHGHIKLGPIYNEVTRHFSASLPKVEYLTMDFYQKLYFTQSNAWYSMMIQDFPNHFRHAKRWIDLFDEYPKKKQSEMTLYIKGLHNVLSALFMNNATKKFLLHHEKLMKFKKSDNLKITINEKSQLTLYQTLHTIHKIYLTAEYSNNLKHIPAIEDLINKNPYNWDNHRILVLKYKVACVYFGASKFDKAITLLNLIINKNYSSIRQDIQCYARILNLAAHFNLGNETLVNYQVRSVYRFLLKMDQQEKVLQEIFKFLRKTPNILPSKLKTEFRKLRATLRPLSKDPKERRPFIYFDIISWLDSRINGTKIELEVQKKIRK